jgi:two-component system sensor histidine kinase KdpD
MLVAVAITCAATALSLAVFGRDQLPDVVMIYLLGIMVVAGRFGLRESVLAALLGVAAFDFFFVPPYLTFTVAELRHATTFLVMFLVAIVISGLTQRIRNQAVAARERELRTSALYELSRELAAAPSTQDVIQTAASHLEQVFDGKVTVFMRGPGVGIQCVHGAGHPNESAERDLGIARWVWANQHEAGLGTGTLPGSNTLYIPLRAAGGMVGVLGLLPHASSRFAAVEQRRQLEAFAAQTAVAMERAILAEETDKTRREIEVEQLRSSLLSSVSHDLRTPLAVITGATSTLLQRGVDVGESTRAELLGTVLEEAERLNRLIRNLLDMTRLESGAVKVKKEWLPLEELVGAALNRLEGRLADRTVQVELAPDLPLVPCDPVLIEQVLINLLENAASYSRGVIEIRGYFEHTEAIVEVGDSGPGIAPGQEASLFEKFQRGAREGNPEGVGLGLTISRAIVTAHGGRIWAENRQAGGASFRFALPVEGLPPLPAPEPVEPTREASRV